MLCSRLQWLLRTLLPVSCRLAASLAAVCTVAANMAKTVTCLPACLVGTAQAVYRDRPGALQIPPRAYGGGGGGFTAHHRRVDYAVGSQPPTTHDAAATAAVRRQGCFYFKRSYHSKLHIDFILGAAHAPLGPVSGQVSPRLRACFRRSFDQYDYPDP